MTKYAMYGKMVIHALLRRRARILVALLAVAIGATILSGLITIYYDVPRQMGREFRSYGANLIFIPAGNNQILLADDLARAGELLPKDKVIGVAPYLYERVKVNEQPIMAAGTIFQEVKRVSPYWHVIGRWPDKADGIVIGNEVAELMKLEPGHKVTLAVANASNEKTLTVEGIVRTGGPEENMVFADLAMLQQLLNKEGHISLAQVSIMGTEAELTALSWSVEQKVAGISPQLVKRVTQSESQVLSKLQALVYLVTIIILLLTLICAATTMIAVVTERRKEIGLKKALGAENRSIILEFLGEGLVLGGLGGAIGTILGFFFAQAVSINVFGRAITFQPFIAMVAFVVSVGVSGLACLIPVKIAIDVEPAIVLRGE
jgi:putative ABC transport system permease protein